MSQRYGNQDYNISILQMKTSINKVIPNFNFDKILNRQGVLDVFNRMIINGEYSIDVMEEIEEEIKKRDIPYNMDSVLNIIQDGVNLLKIQDQSNTARYQLLSQNRNYLNSLSAYRNESNYLLINSVKIPATFFSSFQRNFSIIVSVSNDNKVYRSYDTKRFFTTDAQDYYQINEQIPIDNFSDDCTITLYGDRDQNLGYIFFRISNLNLQIDNTTLHPCILNKITNNNQTESAQTDISLNFSINNVEKAKIQLNQEIDLFENDMQAVQQNLQKLLQPFIQIKGNHYLNQSFQNSNQILNNSGLSYQQGDEIKRAQREPRQVQQQAEQDYNIHQSLDDISIFPDRPTQRPLVEQPITPHAPVEFDLHILFIVYLGIVLLFGGKKSNMVDVCICLYFLSSLLTTEDKLENNQLLKKRTMTALGFVVVYDLFWMIFIGSHWLARDQSDDQGNQNAQRIFSFIMTLLLMIFRGFLIFLVFTTNVEQFTGLKSNFKYFLTLQSKNSDNHQQNQPAHQVPLNY